MTADKRKLEIAMAKACITRNELQEKAGVGLNQVKAVISGKALSAASLKLQPNMSTPT